MENTRRKFITTSMLAAGTVAAGSMTLLASSDPLVEVQGFVSKYGACREVEQGSSATVLTVKMRSPQALAKVMTAEKGLPFERIFANGNTLSFKHRGVDFTVENIA